MADLRTVEEKLLKARVNLCLKAPFLANALLRLPIRVGPPCITTMATDGYRIFYNPEFVKGLSDAKIRGVLCHELMHVLTDSCGRRNGRIPELWNIACDYAVNAVLFDLGFSLPKGCLFSDDYAKMTSEEIYDKVYKDFEREGKIVHIVLKSNRDSKDSRNGNGLGEIPSDIGKDVVIEASEESRSLPPPEPGEPNDRESIRVALGNLRKEFEDHCKKMGNFPGGLEGELEIARNPRVDWKAVLQHCLIDRVKTDWNMYPPSKKHLWQGIYLPSVGVPSPCKLVFAVDTSGSVSDATLSAIYAEIRNFRETFPSPLVIIQCDTAISDVKEYGEYEDFEDPDYTKVFGRGGTTFIPVFDWVKEHCYGESIFIVHATDGWGEFPESCDHPILWLLPRNHNEEMPDWGQKIVISEH